jgi:hypothetical protein
MSYRIDRINIDYCADRLATALLRAGKDGHLTKIGIDDIRAAVVGYLAGSAHFLTKRRTEAMVEIVLRKTIQKVG